MPYTFDQSLAFLNALVTSPKVKAHLEGAIGFGKLPKPEDFDKSTDATIRANCDELVCYLDEILGVLKEVSDCRPRQGEIDGVVPEKKPARKRQEAVGD